MTATGASSEEETYPDGGPSDDPLTSSVYLELRSLAEGLLRRRKPGAMLQTTSLVHEAYLSPDISRV